MLCAHAHRSVVRMTSTAINSIGQSKQNPDPKLLKAIGDLLGRLSNDLLTLKLAQRRIMPDIIMIFNIRARGRGWTYPTPHGALRFKNADSFAPNKYAWVDDKRDTLLYGSDLQNAIQEAGGHIWLVTEFDFFAMQSAGIYNVIAQLQGEGSVPNDLLVLLQPMSVLACHIAPDRDHQGAAWAQLVANKLAPADIQVYAHELPYPLQQKHGGDIGQLWQEYSHPEPFEKYLLQLPVTVLRPTNEIKKEKPARNYVISEDLRSRIASALGVSSYGSDGYSKKIPCPFHDDDNPSAGLHREYGLHCFTEGKWFRWRDLAAVVGVSWKL